MDAESYNIHLEHEELKLGMNFLGGRSLYTTSSIEYVCVE
jgi:hypothetical protein